MCCWRKRREEGPMERVIQFTMREREIKALLAVLAVWNGMSGVLTSQAVLDKYLQEAGGAQGWPPEHITAAKQRIRDAMKFLMSGGSFENSPLAWIERVHQELVT